MPRRKPVSNKQKKAALQEKRALKRGEIPAGSSAFGDGEDGPSESRGGMIGGGRGRGRGRGRVAGKGSLDGRGRGAGESGADSAQALKVRALQSRFLKLSPIYLARTQAIAFNVPLPRPVPSTSAIYKPLTDREDKEDSEKRARLKDLMKRLTCPRRPKWRYGMTKREVERNEEGLFVKWMDEMKDIMSDFLSLDDEENHSMAASMSQSQYSIGSSFPGSASGSVLTTRQAMKSVSTSTADLSRPIRSPSYYEQNLEVWRQLWRVTEQSNILLVLMDIRCPPVHFPASLRAYVREIMGLDGRQKPAKPRKKVVLVLTKMDLVSPACVEGWKKWCMMWWKYGEDGPPEGSGIGNDGSSDHSDADDIDVVAVESYKREALRPESLRPLIDAIQRAYCELCEPPESIRDDDVKSASWRADLETKMKPDVDWSAFERMLSGEEEKAQMEGVKVRKGKRVLEHGDASAAESQSQLDREDDEGDASENEVLDGNTPKDDAEASDIQDRKVDFLTLGLIGQPNVGKSSLLNALLGESKVTASKTPGKTKHFQSIFWSRDVRIVDCPGLVLPSFAGVETQVMAGTCIHHVAGLMPLEEILRLPEPQRWAEERAFYNEVESRKTTREEDGATTAANRSKEICQWMAGDIMTGWAQERGFLTAKAGRPDTNRAGNAVMRMIAEGRIPYRFFAPGTPVDEVDSDPDIRDVTGKPTGRGIWCPSAFGEFSQHAEDLRRDEEEELESERTESDVEQQSDPSDGENSDGEEDEDEDEDEDEVEQPKVRAGVASRFAALLMQEGDDDDEDENENDDSDDDDEDEREKK